MLHFTFKNLLANRVRFAMTGLAVVLGVAFVVSSFVLTDGLRSTFGDLSEEIVDGTDLEVRPVDEFGAPTQLPDTVADRVAAVDGVDAAAARIEGGENEIRPINAEGEEIDSMGPPQLAFSWISDPDLSRFTVVTGEPPSGDGEFAMDVDSAEVHGFELGRTYDLITPTGLTQSRLTALTSFGTANDTLGATLLQFEPAALQDLLGRAGYDAVSVAVDAGADLSEVQAAVAAAVPDVEVVDNATLEREQKDDFNQGIDLIGNVLLGFAGVSVFVSVFIIANTFSIVLSQRTRELALVRSVGAEPRQIRRSVQAEALVIGVVSSAVGIAVGIGLAFGLRGIFNAIGASIPDTPLVLDARTVVVACVVGIVVTFVAAAGPARRASRVSAIAGLRDGEQSATGSSAGRALSGLLVTLAGAAAGTAGLAGVGSTATQLVALAGGAIAVFVGTSLFSPVLVGPLTMALGWPLRKLGISGRLAGANASRNPRRTASTAAALMIGLALVSMALTVGESVKAQLRSTLDSSVMAEYLITEDSDAPLPAGLEADVVATGVVSDVVAFHGEDALLAGEVRGVTAADHQQVAALFDLGIVAGTAHDESVADPVLVSDDEADASSIQVGDLLPITFASGTSLDLEVIGVFSDDIVVDDDYLVSSGTWSRGAGTEMIDWLGFTTIDADEATLAAAFGGLEAQYPQATLETANEFVERIEGFVDQALAALNILVALAVVIALIGIANALALSVFERTRELGLLRAVGMTRRQTRRMVRYEAALVALFGAVLGVAIGVGFGWAAVLALPSSVTSTIAVPTGRIALLVVVAALAGLLAAWAPARRAGRLDVLRAIGA